MGDIEDQDGAEDGELTCRGTRGGRTRRLESVAIRAHLAPFFWPFVAAHRLSGGIWGTAHSSRGLMSRAQRWFSGVASCDGSTVRREHHDYLQVAGRKMAPEAGE